MHCEVTSPLYFGSEKAILHAPNIQLHRGVQDRFWVLAEGHSGNIRVLVLKEWYSAQGKKNAVLLPREGAQAAPPTLPQGLPSCLPLGRVGPCSQQPPTGRSKARLSLRRPHLLVWGFS